MRDADCLTIATRLRNRVTELENQLASASAASATGQRRTEPVSEAQCHRKVVEYNQFGDALFGYSRYSGREVFIGPREGLYYISSGGGKQYLKRGESYDVEPI